MRVGVAGLGKMGSIFADRIKAGGHELAVWNRTPHKAKAVAGGSVAASPAELASRCEVVLTMVSDDADAFFEGRGGDCQTEKTEDPAAIEAAMRANSEAFALLERGLAAPAIALPPWR